ncbi:hypothetical protein HH308_04560 [Gordonia sp. TBRC 11910]|uniref:Uncharacterized protein n=1 Tax=Gordonia asplenii TaxID=2725283 RepID=A0A848KUE7_9ACTN|nr:hypothetical protein [Gordonia asplenii]NMO00485.1 hypothetical protein [Gordonia asplenii]
MSTVEGAVNRLRHEISDLDDISALYLANSDQAWRFNGLHCLAVTGLAGEVDAGYRLFEKLCLSGPLSDEGRADLADDGAKLLQALDRRELGRQLIESVAEQARRKREGEAQREVERRERIAANAERDRTRVIKPLTVKKEFRRPGRSGE